MLNDTSVASAGSYNRTCRRIRNSKKIATIRDFHQNISVNSTIRYTCLRLGGWLGGASAPIARLRAQGGVWGGMCPPPRSWKIFELWKLNGASWWILLGANLEQAMGKKHSSLGLTDQNFAFCEKFLVYLSQPQCSKRIYAPDTSLHDLPSDLWSSLGSRLKRPKDSEFRVEVVAFRQILQPLQMNTLLFLHYFVISGILIGMFLFQQT